LHDSVRRKFGDQGDKTLSFAPLYSINRDSNDLGTANPNQSFPTGRTLHQSGYHNATGFNGMGRTQLIAHNNVRSAFEQLSTGDALQELCRMVDDALQVGGRWL